MFGKNRHSDNSDNSLVNSGQYSHSHIPMEQFSVTPIPANNLNTKEKIEHDPLPPAVDYSGVSPSAKYQFRALSRRALSYHRRQRLSNVCCLVLWPVMLVLICFGIAMTTGKDSSKSFKIAFCTNEANPATGFSFTLTEPPAVLISRDNKIHNAWYPSGFLGGGSSNLPCVRWFGSTYPNKAPYENVTAADRAQPDA